MRRIAGTLALLALVFSLAESVWASTCAPSMGMHPAAADVDSDLPVHHGCPHAGVVGEDAKRDAPPCPFGSPLAAQACAGVVSMPGAGAPMIFAASDRADGLFAVPSRADLLLESGLFRPPRV